MVLAAGLRVVRTVQRFNRKYQYLNPTDKFIRKFVPPNYRGKATRFARYAEAGSFGGIAYEIAQDLLSDGTSNPNAVPKRTLNERRRFSKTRYRRGRYSNKYRKRCSCRRKRRY